jgi:hypothetical protein
VERAVTGSVAVLPPSWEVLGQYQERFGAVHLIEVGEAAAPNRF